MYTLRRFCILAAAICCLASDGIAQSGAPDTVNYAGQRHRSFGGARLTRLGETIRLTTIAAGGGAIIDLNQSDGYCVMFGPAPDTSNSQAKIRVSTMGRRGSGVVDSLYVVTAERVRDSVHIRFINLDPVQSGFRIEAYFEDTLLATLNRPFTGGGSDGDIGDVGKNHWPYWLEGQSAQECRPFHGRLMNPDPGQPGAGGGNGAYWIGFGPMDLPGSGRVPFRLPDGRTVMPNILRIVPVYRAGDSIDYISHAVVRYSGLPNLTIAGEMIYDFDRQHKAIGEVELLASGGKLRVTGRDTSQFGVQANFCNASSFGFELDSVFGGLVNGSKLVFTAVGSSGGGASGPVGTLTMEVRGDRNTLSVDLSADGSPTNRIDIFSNGQLVTSVRGQTGVSVETGRFHWPHWIDKLFDRPRCYRAKYLTRVPITIPGKGTFTGDEVRLLSENPADSIPGIYTSVNIIASRWPTFTILNEMEAGAPSAPDSLLFAGLWHTALNGSSLRRNDSGLHVSQGDTTMGTRIELGESGGHCLMLAPINVGGAGPASLEVATIGSLRGGAPDTLATIIATRQGDAVMLRYRPGLLRAAYRVEVYMGSTLVGSMARSASGPGTSDTILPRITWPKWLEFRHKVDRCPKWSILPKPDVGGTLGDFWIGLGSVMDPTSGAMPVTLSDGRRVMANLIRIIPVARPGDSIDFISSEVIRSSGIANLTIQDERLYSFGRLHGAIGETELVAFDGKLRVAGRDTLRHGVLAEFCEAASFGFEIDTANSSPLPDGAKLVFDAFGSVGGRADRPVGSLMVEKRGSQYAISVDLSSGGSPTNRVEIYANGQLVKAISGQTGVSALSSPRPRWWDKFGRWPRCFRARYLGRVPIVVPGHGTFTGDEVRLLSENLSDSISVTYSSVRITAQRWPTFTILQENEVNDLPGPGAILFAGLWHTPVGAARLERTGTALRLPAVTGGGGVEIALGKSEGYCLMLAPIAAAGGSPSGFEVATIGRRGGVVDTLYRIVARQSGDRVILGYRPGLVRGRYSVEAYNGTRFVGIVKNPDSGTGGGMDTIAASLRWPRWLEGNQARNTRCWDQHRFFAQPTPSDSGDNGSIWIGLGHPELPDDGATLVTLGDGRQVMANVLRVVPSAPRGVLIEEISKIFVEQKPIGYPLLTIDGVMIYEFGRRHMALGDAELVAMGDSLYLTKEDSSRYGVRAFLSYASAFGFELDDTRNVGATLPAGAEMLVETEGFVEGGPYRPFGSMLIKSYDSLYHYSADLSAVGSPTNRIEVLANGQKILTVNAHTGVSAMIPRIPRWIRKRPGGGGEDNPSCFAMSFPRETAITIPGHGTVRGDELRLLSENVADTGRGVYSWASIAVRNWPSFTILNETETLDSRVSGVTDPNRTTVWTGRNGIELADARPNPLSRTTQIGFRLSASEPAVWLTVSDIAGNELVRLIDGTRLNAGEHRIEFDASGLPGGVYYYTLRTRSGGHSRILHVVR